MPISRRSFLAGATVAPLFLTRSSVAEPAGLARGGSEGPRAAPAQPPSRFEPWIEVDPRALRTNVSVLSRLAGERPVLAVIKNNAYGLGLLEVARVLEGESRVAGFAVVKSDDALALRAAGIRKPILLLALFDDADGEALVRAQVTLGLCVGDVASRVSRALARAGGTARGHLYIDTGMSRMGVPYHAALPMLRDVSRIPALEVTGMLTELTEARDFDGVQLRRLTDLAARARAEGLATGALHAASSHAIFNDATTHLDLVRPGIALFGGYPGDDVSERRIASLEVALRLKARVVRVEQLREGDTVSYGRRYTARAPTWVATIPLGHADGYPRRAVNGAHVLIGGRRYPVIGAVSASHTIVELGPDTTVSVGDVATMFGPDDDAIHPNTIARTIEGSVYDLFMHLNPGIPRVLV